MIMKKVLFFATLVACSLMFFGCNKNGALDPNQDAIARVKTDAMGSWKGVTQALVGEGEEVVLTFTETKVTAEFADETVNANITAWKCVDGKEVWIELDDDLKTAVYIDVQLDAMTTRTNTSFGLNVFPPQLTRVKK